MVKAVLFDLDDTLVPDVGAAFDALEATAELAAERHGIRPASLRLAARKRARELWYAFLQERGCDGFGLSSWEALCSDFEGHDPQLAEVRAWTPGYRTRTWQLALADLGVADPGLAAELARRFRVERARRYTAYPDVLPALERLRPRFTLGLDTNGPSDLQMAKLQRAGIERFFDVVAISMEVGLTKPDPAIFRYALDRLGLRAGAAVMVGNSLRSDVTGAKAAGIRTVRIIRPRPPDDYIPADSGPEPDATIESLAELEAIVDRL
jgi:putative hydrolase of the HAD superfamily